MLPMQQKVRYDVARMMHDAAGHGWMPVDLIRKSKVSLTHGYRFLRGETHSPRTAEKLTKALGKGKGHYLLKLEREAVA